MKPGVVAGREPHPQVLADLLLRQGRVVLGDPAGAGPQEQGDDAVVGRPRVRTLGQVARDRLGMKFPEGTETVVIRP